MREADFGRPDDRRTAEIAPSEIGVVARDSEGVMLAAELSEPCLTAPPNMSDRPVGCCFWPRFFPLDPYCQLRLIRASNRLYHREWHGLGGWESCLMPRSRLRPLPGRP
jgi:hypothetical protein